MQKKNGRSDIEDVLADTVEDKENRMNGESNTDMYTSSCAKETAGEELLRNAGVQTGTLS